MSVLNHFLDQDSPLSGASVNNEWLFNQDHILNSYNPTNGQMIGQVFTVTSAQQQDMLEASCKAWQKWRMVPAPKRGELIRVLGELLRENKDALGSLVAMEMGKSKQEGDGEVQEMIDMADFAVGLSRMLYGKTMHSERPQHRMYEQWHPLGVTAVITAFNFPVAVWAWNAMLAAVCGNTVIWRPSPKTPLCAVAVHKLCIEASQRVAAPGVFSLAISDEVSLVQELVQDTRVPLVSFTGSSFVGRKIAQQVSDRFARSLLELSGNNAAIIDETADLSQALISCVFGAIGTAGQRCTSLRRLYIARPRYHEVLEKLEQAYGQLKVGDPLDTTNHMGPVIDKESVAYFEKVVAQAKAQGGEVVFGGKVIEGEGYFVEPTIIKVDSHCDLLQEEHFVPILFVAPYDDLFDAIEANNSVKHGLSSALFTKDLQQSERFLSAAGSDCGIANVNIGTSGAEIGGAFGGEKHTGGGREAGSDAWKAYMRRQTNTINWGNEVPLAQGICFSLEDAT